MTKEQGEALLAYINAAIEEAAAVHYFKAHSGPPEVVSSAIARRAETQAAFEGLLP